MCVVIVVTVVGGVIDVDIAAYVAVVVVIYCVERVVIVVDVVAIDAIVDISVVNCDVVIVLLLSVFNVVGLHCYCCQLQH